MLHAPYCLLSCRQKACQRARMGGPSEPGKTALCRRCGRSPGEREVMQKPCNSGTELVALTSRANTAELSR